jgi:glycosyltransferase involved in cell wall biosynthesis
MRLKRALVLLTYNEIEALPKLFDKIPLSAADEVFAVDGGSQDGTAAYLESKGVKVLGQPRRGRGCAFNVALDATTADVICYYSPDGNEDPADIPKVFEKLEAGGYDLVVASRMCAGAHNEEDEETIPLRKWVNQAFTLLANLFWNRGPYVTDTINGFRAVRADSLRRCECRVDGFVIEYLMTMRMMKLGMRIGEIPTYESPRLGGQSTAHSWPTGLEFTRHLIRELFLGRGVARANERAN